MRLRQRCPVAGSWLWLVFAACSFEADRAFLESEVQSSLALLGLVSSTVVGRDKRKGHHAHEHRHQLLLGSCEVASIIADA